MTMEDNEHACSPIAEKSWPSRKKFNRSLNRSFGKRARRHPIAVFRPTTQVLQTRNKELAVSLQRQQLEARDLNSSIVELQRENTLLNEQITQLKEQLSEKSLTFKPETVKVLRLATSKLIESIELITNTISVASKTTSNTKAPQSKIATPISEHQEEKQPNTLCKEQKLFIETELQVNADENAVETEPPQNAKATKKRRMLKIGTPKGFCCFKSPRAGEGMTRRRTNRGKNICYKEPSTRSKLRRGDKFFADLTNRLESRGGDEPNGEPNNNNVDCEKKTA